MTQKELNQILTPAEGEAAGGANGDAAAPEASDGGAAGKAAAAPKAKKPTAAAPKAKPPPKTAKAKPAGVAKPKPKAAPQQKAKASAAAAAAAKGKAKAAAKPAAGGSGAADSVEAFLAAASPAIPQARSLRAAAVRHLQKRNFGADGPFWALSRVFALAAPAHAQALAAKLRAAQVTTGAQMRQLASFDAGVQVRFFAPATTPRIVLFFVRRVRLTTVLPFCEFTRCFCRSVLRRAAAGAAQGGAAGRVPGAHRAPEARVKAALLWRSASAHTRTYAPYTHTALRRTRNMEARLNARECARASVVAAACCGRCIGRKCPRAYCCNIKHAQSRATTAHARWV